MKVLAIYGASGFGREVLELAQIINRSEKRWDSFVFIDDGDVDPIISGCKVYKYHDAITEYNDEIEVVVGIGEPIIRESIFEKLRKDGVYSPNLVHPGVYIPESTKLGKGVVIQYGCFISCNAQIKDYVYIQPQCNIGHDDVLSEGCMISGLCNLGGLVNVGKWSYLGLSSVVKQMITIGDYSIVGMGSVVQKDIPDLMITMGNPARVIAKNERRRVFA